MYSETAEPLTRLTRKDEPLVWGSQQQLAVENMITTFRTAPALHDFDHEREVIIGTDASDYMTTGALSQ